MNTDNAHDDDLPDLTNHFGASRNAKTARRKHGSASAQRSGSALSKEVSTESATGLFTPPTSQSQAEMDARRMLISPPPEEFLRRNRTAAGRL